MRKQLTALSCQLFLRKSSTIDVWQSSRYASVDIGLDYTRSIKKCIIFPQFYRIERQDNFKLRQKKNYKLFKILLVSVLYENGLCETGWPNYTNNSVAVFHMCAVVGQIISRIIFDLLFRLLNFWKEMYLIY